MIRGPSAPSHPAADFYQRAAVPCQGVWPVHYRAKTCALDSFDVDAAATLRALSGRTLWLLGDSTLSHQHDALECLLGARGGLSNRHSPLYPCPCCCILHVYGRVASPVVYLLLKLLA